MAVAPRTIQAQPGPQTEFLKSSADVVLYGGSAGGGKSAGLLLESLRHIHVPGYNAVLFRRTRPQITAEGGLWDTSREFYLAAGGVPFVGPLEWRFPSGATIRMAYLQHDKDVDGWQGSQICKLGFDEITHFSKRMFFGLLSRNRSACGVRPSVRATCNPENTHWIREAIDWWIDERTGLAIPERSGVIRWFQHINGNLIWHEKEVADAKSFTFIAAKLSDNKILTDKDPGYLTNLKNLTALDRARLLDGNWNAKPAAGMYWRRYNIETIDVMPAVSARVRSWDIASTAPHEGNPDPDWTVGALLAEVESVNGKTWIIEDIERLQGSPLSVTSAILNTAKADGIHVKIALEEQPGAAGAFVSQRMVSQLAGYRVTLMRPSGDKLARFGPFSSQAEAGNVKCLRGKWNDAMHSELEALGGGKDNDDQADAISQGYAALTSAAATPRARSLA